MARTERPGQAGLGGILRSWPRATSICCAARRRPSSVATLTPPPEVLDPEVRWYGAGEPDAEGACHNREQARAFIRPLTRSSAADSKTGSAPTARHPRRGRAPPRAHPPRPPAHRLGRARPGAGEVVTVHDGKSPRWSSIRPSRTRSTPPPGLPHDRAYGCFCGRISMLTGARRTAIRRPTADALPHRGKTESGDPGGAHCRSGRKQKWRERCR